jgi:hypothetical protein
MLERQGIKPNRKKLYRLYNEERLTVRRPVAANALFSSRFKVVGWRQHE